MLVLADTDTFDAWSLMGEVYVLLKQSPILMLGDRLPNYISWKLRSSMRLCLADSSASF